MTVPYRILLGAPERNPFILAPDQLIQQTFDEINTIYNKWNPHSELSRINASKSQESILLSEKLYTFLQTTDAYVKLTDGRFDPTIEPAQQAWKKALSQKRILSEEERNELKSSVGWHLITLEDGSLTKKNEDVQIDLGGIVKGYAVDLLVERLNAAGYPDVFVEWGGEVRVSGAHPDKRPWTIYISRLGDNNPDHAIAILELNNESVATSGDYLQQWTVDNRTYFHIIDPVRLEPLIATHRSIASVTVKAPTCLEADVLATSAMLFQTVPEAEAWAEGNFQATFWILSRQAFSQEVKSVKVEES